MQTIKLRRVAVAGHDAGLVVLGIFGWEHAAVGSAGDRDMDQDEPGTVPGQHYQAEASPFRPPPRRPLLQRIVPVAEHIAGYRRQTLGRDALAGVTVAALALPAGMAYAELAGLSPVNGLYALLLPAVAYAVLGSARMLIVGPEGAIAAMVGAALIPITQDPGERAS